MHRESRADSSKASERPVGAGKRRRDWVTDKWKAEWKDKRKAEWKDKWKAEWKDDRTKEWKST